MSINIKIGNKTFTKDGIIYISPNGNDSNNGLTEDTPVKSFNKAVSLSSNNYAIKFMKGNHTITVTSPIDLYSKTNLIFFSDPKNTLITINYTATTSAGSNLLSDSTFNIYNLRIRIVWSAQYPSITTLSAIVNAYNCSISIVLSKNSQFYCNLSTSSKLYNSIIYCNYSPVRGQQSSIMFNCVRTSNFSTTGSNCVNFTSADTTQVTIESSAKKVCTDTIGIYAGDYSEWFTEIIKHLVKDVNENSYYGINDSNDQLLFTDLNVAMESSENITLQNINNNLPTLDLYSITRLNNKVKV